LFHIRRFRREDLSRACGVGHLPVSRPVHGGRTGFGASEVHSAQRIPDARHSFGWASGSNQSRLRVLPFPPSATGLRLDNQPGALIKSTGNFVPILSQTGAVLSPDGGLLPGSMAKAATVASVQSRLRHAEPFRPGRPRRSDLQGPTQSIAPPLLIASTTLSGDMAIWVFADLWSDHQSHPVAPTEGWAKIPAAGSGRYHC
jgi:hypothetical protein